MNGTLEHDAILAFLSRTVDADRAAMERPEETIDAFAALDLAPGAPVLIAMPNGRALLSTFFAVLLAGAVPVPMPPASGAARITAIAERLGAAGLIAPRIEPRRYLATRTHPLGVAEAVLFPGNPVRYRRGDVVLMTSGTAGIASGCLHGIDALLRNASRHADAIRQREDDTILVSLPLHYSYALVAQALAALVRGSRLVVSGPPFTPRAYANTVWTHEVTVSSLTPSTATRLVEDPPDLPASLRVLTVGGDTLEPRHVKALLADRELYLTYGLTEAGPRVATLAAHIEPEHRWSSVGVPLPGVKTRLRDGEELLVESDTVLRRRLPEGSPDPLTSTGAVATGDRFEIDDDGYHYFRGRLSDSVVVGGEKVWLPSVRRIAAGVPGVRHCATTVYRDDSDELRYDLEVAVDDPGPRQAAEIQRALNRLLLRSERPHRITVRPAMDGVWHK
ncbi:acyl-CoA synthetase (AMP-forming)/AMP-acid ligase II [Kibdelosporangium banguiense]|uniref:Acyl-CoA synthetase (AMP-forming)/AMP-acid ligase II n=1 Tax=Kibdelosporangium banguiense TaxID=1365924 RepID=A0ABS4U1N4_9PSEU|nr:class I adenylate-forming enzyme family protein [Kibdelosporangium banguiense]MBP2330541.1 acyl-CoA synthetase (AMP-forming)/AMP-acid ligase II [Kibdelosporangium banguiense]